MNSMCQKCRGGCCRVVTIPVKFPSASDRAFYETRGFIGSGLWHVRSRCKYLSWRGRCKIYGRRPKACAFFPVGGTLCRAVRKGADRP